MAKSGVIKILNSAEPGDSVLADSVVQSEAPQMTYGAVVAALLLASVAPLQCRVVVAESKVIAFPSGTSLSNLTPGLLFTLSRDAVEGVLPKSATWSMQNVGDATEELTVAVEALVGTAPERFRPRRSLSALISAIEDAATTRNIGGLLIVADQAGDGVVSVFTGHAEMIYEFATAVAAVELDFDSPEEATRLAFE